MRNPIRPAAFAAAAALAAAACGVEPIPSARDGSGDTLATVAQAFWATLASHCGRAYTGRVSDATAYYQPAFAAGEPLVMHVLSCDDDRIHAALHIGDDRSRNWILTRTGGTIRLKHDHRHEDGSEDAITQYGGDAPVPGLPERQIFPADAHTAAILPQRADNFWFFHFVDEHTLQYGVHWPRLGHSVRLEFDLSRPVEPPPRPWGY